MFAEDKTLLREHKGLLHCLRFLLMRFKSLLSVWGEADSSGSQFNSVPALAAEQGKNLYCHLFNYLKRCLAW